MIHHSTDSDRAHSSIRFFFCAVASALIGAAWLSCSKDIARESEPNGSFSAANPLRPNEVILGHLGTRNDQDFFRLEVAEPRIADIQLGPVKGINHSLRIWRGETSPVSVKLVDDMRKSSPERICNLYLEAGVYYITVGFGERDEPSPGLESGYELLVRDRAPGESDEREPNDDRESAQRIEPGRDLSGFFSPAYNRQNAGGEFPLREEDWFACTPELKDGRPAVIDLELSAVAGINPVLYLYNPSLELITAADAGSVNEGESIRDIGISTPGTYYIMVASKSFESNHELPYRLSISMKELDVSSELEPNNAPERANAMAADKINGKAWPEGDRDYFLYRGKGGPELYRVEAIPPGGLDLMLSLLDGQGNRIFEIDNGERGEPEVMPDAPFSGEFYSVVSSKRGQADRDNNYRLSVTRLPRGEAYELEPNDSRERATKLGGGLIKGYISKKKDTDYYCVERARRERLRFSIKGINRASLRFSVTDPSGYVIAGREVKGNRIGTISEIIDGRAYVVVEAMAENYDEPYVLTVRGGK